MPNVERDEEGKLLLVRTIRDCRPRRVGDNRKNVKRTDNRGEYFKEYSNVMGDRGIKLNLYKERFLPQREGTCLTPRKWNCRSCGKPAFIVLGTTELCPDCLESHKESQEP
jgi:hypothetical protein